MQITVTVPDEFAREAAARGLTVEDYAQQVLSLRGNPLEPVRSPSSSSDDVRTFGQRFGLRLGPGLSLRDLINEGRRF
ncbi:MAG: hypothetical protein JST11_19615 [Acidobacteria bacterium]|nr:hypothetical protein [Acidobacteriota bacterium]